MAKKKSANRKVKAQRILAKDEFVSNDTWETGLNNNDLIVGPTGAGKTRYYVKPNLLQMNESVVVTDTKGTLVREVGPVLEAHGYDVIHVDFTDPAAGCGYNPLDFISVDPVTGYVRERDIMRIANALCPLECNKEPFWDYAAKMVIGCLVGYVMECLPEEDHTLKSVLDLTAELWTDVAKQLMKELCVQRPECFTARKWRAFEGTEKADKMYASIVGIVAEKLDPLTYDDLFTMFGKDKRVDFTDLGKRKTALFLTVSDTDRSADRLVSLFYTQAIQQLCELADDSCEGGALPVPVRLYLDDFATNCKIEDFDKTISVIRSRNIAVSIVLQSITQLDTLYGHASSMTIVNGCDHMLYLGGQDVETIEYVSMKANKTFDTVAHQPLDAVWLFERGKRGKAVERFDLRSHGLYGELPEALPKPHSTNRTSKNGEPTPELEEEEMI